MKKIFFIVFVLTNSFASIAQQPEVLKMKKDTRYGKATYYVLKSDTSVYHGRFYIDAWTGNKKLVDGNYSYGEKRRNMD